ncbi:hypothetical protein RSOL_248850 [Rhizoctonia solani AG-3 Rhs1AP]|uniref:Uncharacterized protein n=2 Tax=Rhizoctonia solani AG-3 TaxID=1086053 RepID=A0A074SP95_9AGAM|nr:hypothetical protein RSOL_248850 [Rhizoctonia solani AG-3 Rhs1AP]KEP51822.1 hypothetical protein V565_054960 [Rhizoctonia solani 123E]
MPAPPPITFGPSFASKHLRKSMDFTKNWGEGEMFAWYGRRRERSENSVALAQLQVRIDTNGAFPHRFVVAFMKDGSIVRFDRAPQTGKLGSLLNETLGPAKYRNAADHFASLAAYEVLHIEASTRCELKFNLPDGADLLLVLSAAFAIANDAELCKYTLATFNCFFFSWTIVMIVVRHAIPFTIPPPERVISHLNPVLPIISSSLARKIFDGLLSLVTDTITTFRSKTSRLLSRGLSKGELVIWRLPTTLLKDFFKTRLIFGPDLEDALNRAMRSQLQEQVDPLLRRVFTMASQSEESDHIQNRLWVHDLGCIFGPLVRRELLKIVWTTLLQVLEAGYADIDTKAISDQVVAASTKGVPYPLSGASVAQLTCVWNEALHHALPAAMNMICEDDEAASNPKSTLDNLDDEQTMHKEMFNNVFNVARDAILQAAKQAVSDTGCISSDSRRSDMWKEVWSIWPDVWASAQAKTEEMAVGSITETMSEIVDLVAMGVIKAVGEDSEKYNAIAYERVSQYSSFHISTADPREQVNAHIERVQTGMTRAWVKSKNTYKPLFESLR